jgi:hypothetical protein
MTVAGRVSKAKQRAGAPAPGGPEKAAGSAPASVLQEVSSTSKLGVMALAMLARHDPVAAFFRRTEGRLGPDHDLEY